MISYIQWVLQTHSSCAIVALCPGIDFIKGEIFLSLFPESFLIVIILSGRVPNNVCHSAPKIQ